MARLNLNCRPNLTWLITGFVCYKSDITGVTTEAGTAYPSGSHEFNHGFQSDSCCSIFSFMCRSGFVLFRFAILLSVFPFTASDYLMGLSRSWSYSSWIYNYLSIQCPSPLMLWVRISIRARCTTLCDKAWQWLATGLWFSPGPLVSSTNKTDRNDITEILLKVVLNTINQTNKQPKLNDFTLIRLDIFISFGLCYDRYVCKVSYINVFCLIKLV